MNTTTSKINQSTSFKGSMFTTTNLALATNGVLAAGRIKSLNEMKRSFNEELELKEVHNDDMFEIDSISFDFINKHLK